MEQYCKIDNLDISYKVDGSGQDLIFLHGWGQNKESFDLTFNVLKNSYKCWSIDLPGFGKSSEPTSDYDIHAYNKVLENFVKINKITNPILICHSFGARVALIFCSRKQTSNKIIFTGGAGLKPKRNLKYHLSVLNYKFMKLLVKTPFYAHYKSDLFANSGSEDYKNASDIMKSVLRNVVNEDLFYTLKLIENEFLLYWGENDDQTPVTDAYVFKENLYVKKLVVKPKSGHYAFLENIENFNKEITDFLK